MHYDFLVETYDTERIKVVSTWSEFRDEEIPCARESVMLAVEACMSRWCISA
jgi:hypothetical protein